MWSYWPGLNRWPYPYQGYALPTELQQLMNWSKPIMKLFFYLTVKKFGSGGRTWTYDLRVMSPTSYQLLHPAIIGGGGRIRTFEGKRRQIYSLLPLATREPHHLLEPTIGLEPTTYWLQVSCSTNWATLAYCSVERSLLYQRTDVLSRTFLSAFLISSDEAEPRFKSLCQNRWLD